MTGNVAFLTEYVAAWAKNVDGSTKSVVFIDFYFLINHNSNQ